MIRTILVPVDFSTCSLLVTRQAAGLAAQLGARLVLLHVAELPAGLSPDARVRPDGVPQAASDLVVDDSRALLVRFADAGREAGIGVDEVVELGPVVPTILAVADRVGADLIVMGTHGRQGLARLVLGSIAEGVTHRAHVPVMLIRREARPECGRASCEWCPESGHSPAEDRLAAESEG